MTYASRLRRMQELTDFPSKRRINAEVIDKIIEQREKAENRNRYVCKTCFTMTSTDKSCYCD